MVTIRDRVYQYYKPYINETNRPEWLKYIDNLLEQGRKYFCKPTDELDYTEIKQEELEKLSRLMFSDNSRAEREEIILGYGDSLLDAVNSFDKDWMSSSIINNILNYFEPHIKDIFEQIEELNI